MHCFIFLGSILGIVLFVSDSFYGDFSKQPVAGWSLKTYAQ